MAINTTLQTIKLDYEQNFETKQIVVQCNLDTTSKGGVSKICQAQSEVVIDNVQTSARQIRVQGKAFIKVLFFNAEGNPQAFDYIADFVEDLNCDKIAEEMDVQVFARVLDTESSASGNQIKIQSVIELMPRALESSTNDYVVEVEGALTQKTLQTAQEFVSKVDETMQVVDTLDTGMSIDEVLLFDCKALLCEAVTEKGDLVASGRCNCEIIYLSGGKIFNQSMCIPFVRELGDGNASTRASVGVVVKDSKLVIAGTEKENILRAEVTLEVCGNIFEIREIQLVSDVFCPNQQLDLTRKCLAFDEVKERVEIEEKISGSVESDNKDCIIKKVVSATVVHCSSENVYLEKDIMICEGLVVVGIIFEDDEEKYNCMQIELPYSLQTKHQEMTSGGNFVGQCLVCDLSTKIKRGREVELDATILIAVSHTSTEKLCGITCIEEGEQIERKRCGISIFLPQSGQTMWDVAKELAMPIDDIKAQNHNLAEIMSGDERVVVYRELQN